VGTQPGASGGGHAERATAQGRDQCPWDHLKLAGGDDHDWSVAQVTGGPAEERILQLRADRLQDAQRAVQVVSGAAAGQTAQGEAGEISGADGVLGPARYEVPYPSGSTGQDMQVAVEVDDLDQLGGS
jgi:hypothetical protein